MPKNKRKRTVVIKPYAFIFRAGRIVVASQDKHDEAELGIITTLHVRYKTKNPVMGPPLTGEWRWCLNPECNNAFYARQDKVEEGYAFYCSRHCVGKVFGAKKGEQAGGLEAKPKRIAAMRASKQKETGQTQKRKEVLVVTVALVPVEVIEPVNDLKEPIKVQLQCSKCKRIPVRIPGNPGICPLCGVASTFITVAIE